MNAVAYCRVSTNKSEQLDSLDAQQNFFLEYANRNGYHLVGIYADEGKSGTKMKNRIQLLRLLSDSRLQLFDTVLIKDVSRLARNTVDFLISIRSLRSLGIRVLFVNYDHTSSDSSEFMLTLLSAIAQEESANTSKRVKFGKEINAQKGRVPNIVYGYDKTAGDYFHLSVNQREAAVVRRIFTMYTEQNIGAAAIAGQLNQEGITTKRNCKWSQNAVSRILHNELYIGNIINGRQEVKNFLTGQRANRGEEDWFVIPRPELQLVSTEVFLKAQDISSTRAARFLQSKNRTSQKHPFSQLLVCNCCGFSFRRYCRDENPSNAKWICGGRNVNGADSCKNKTAISENWLLSQLRRYLTSFLLQKPSLFYAARKEINFQYGSEQAVISGQDSLSLQKQLLKEKQKYMEMYRHDIISMQELSDKNREISQKLQTIQGKAPSPSQHEVSPEALSEDFFSLSLFTNPLLRQIFEKITVSPAGQIEVFLHCFEEKS